MKIKTKSLKDTKNLALNFAKCLGKRGLFVTLTGDIGAGKTQFIRYVLEYLKVDKKVTSPSFVILNEYKCDLFPVYHFDLYRLEQKGLSSIIPELREYSKENMLTFIEWAEFSDTELPFDRIEIKIGYVSDTERSFDFYAIGEKNKKLVEGLKH